MTGQTVRHIRVKMKMTQVEFSSLLGISLRTLTGWERGERAPSGPACKLLGAMNLLLHQGMSGLKLSQIVRAW